MDRVTVRLPDEQLAAVEALVDDGEFSSRSEAIREAVRGQVGDHESAEKRISRNLNR